MTAPATSCLDFSCFDSAQPGPSAQQLGGTMWVGDTAQIYAIAFTDCNHYVSTANDLEKFTFIGDTASTAVTISPTGLVTATHPGTATLLVRTPQGGLSGKYTVTEPIARIEIAFSPASPKLNDTVTITATPLRADGTAITGITLEPMKMVRRKDGTSLPASFLVGATPTLAKFVATQDWTYEVVAKSPTRVNRLGRSDTASVVVTLR
jgi:hypothetical protein